MADTPKGVALIPSEVQTMGLVGFEDEGDLQQMLYREVGSTGLQHLGGYILADFIPKLVGLDGVKAYQEMAYNHPIISGMLFAMTSMIRNIDWTVELPKDAPQGGDAEKRKDLLSHAIFEALDSPWEEVIGEACTMFAYGHAPCEITWKKDSDGLWPHRISLRAQDTINRWQYDADNREVLGLWQIDFMHPPVFIPIEKILNFRTTTERGNPEGRSILRGAYVPYRRQRVIEEAEGRSALRAAGIVVWRIPNKILQAKTGDDLATKQSFLQAVNNSATDRQGAYLIPSDRDEKGNLYYDMEFKTAQSTKSIDMNPIIERLDKRIASTVLADFILLGQQATGSFALSSDKTAMFTEALGAFVRVIEAAVTRQLFRRTWALNGWPPEECPVLVGGNLDAVDLQAIGGFVTSLAGAGMPMFPDDELENYFREQAGWPKKNPNAKPVPLAATQRPPIQPGDVPPKKPVVIGPKDPKPVDDITPAPKK